MADLGPRARLGWCARRAPGAFFLLAHAALCLRAGLVELGASVLLSWMVFLFLVADLAAPGVAPPPAPSSTSRRVVAAVAFAAALALLGFAWAMSGWEQGAGALAAGLYPAVSGETAAALRVAPLLAGCGLLLASALPERGAHRFSPLLALLTPLVSPVPNVLRSLCDLTTVSAWGAQKLLVLVGVPATREGALIVLAHTDLLVNSQCSGLGAILQLWTMLLLLALVMGGPARGALLLVPVAAAIALAINFARLALLSAALAAGQQERFDYWHLHQGSLVFHTVAAAIFLAVALPVLKTAQTAPIHPAWAKP